MTFGAVPTSLSASEAVADGADTAQTADSLVEGERAAQAADDGDDGSGGDGPSCSTNSFPGSTRVLIASGKAVPIRELRVGD